jgi:hypothetical protein
MNIDIPSIVKHICRKGTPGFRGGLKCGLSHLLRGLIERAHIEILTNQGHMSLARARLVVRFPFDRSIVYAEEKRDVFGNRFGDIAKPDEITEPLKNLEENQQTDFWACAFGGLVRQRQFVR